MTQAQKKYTNITVYGKGDSAISFSPLEHYRKKDNDTNENSKGELKGYKLQVTSTLKGFKEDKDSIYLEQEELLNVILVLLGKIPSMKGVRNSTTSNTEKTFSITNKDSNIYVNFDVKDKDKLGFKISNLNKIILFKMIIDILLKEIPRISGIKFNKVELLEYIDDLVENTSNKVESNSNESGEGFFISFINTYKDKDYVNKLEVTEKIYTYLKNTDLSKIDKSKLLSSVKNNTDKEQNKFLNKDNIHTLKVI